LRAGRVVEGDVHQRTPCRAVMPRTPGQVIPVARLVPANSRVLGDQYRELPNTTGIHRTRSCSRGRKNRNTTQPRQALRPRRNRSHMGVRPPWSPVFAGPPTCGSSATSAAARRCLPKVDRLAIGLPRGRSRPRNLPPRRRPGGGRPVVGFVSAVLDTAILAGTVARAGPAG
jgi:hypothetical protein